MLRTPILDLECDPTKMRRSWMPILVGVLIGLALWRWASTDVLSWFPAMCASIAMHEIGHVVAGKFAGMETGGIVICGLMILKSGDRWLCRFDFRRLLSGGDAKPLPKNGDFDPRRYAWMVAGGPFATLLLAAVTGIAYWKSDGAAGWLSSFWWLKLSSVIWPEAADPNRMIRSGRATVRTRRTTSSSSVSSTVIQVHHTQSHHRLHVDFGLVDFGLGVHVIGK